jgi:hypothetical protein
MNDLTTGSLTRHLLQTTSYMLVTMLFQTLYVLVDSSLLGGTARNEAVAAVGISGNLLFLVLGATQMLGVGTTTLVATPSGGAISNAPPDLQPGAGAVRGCRHRLSRAGAGGQATVRGGAQRRRTHPRLHATSTWCGSFRRRH